MGHTAVSAIQASSVTLNHTFILISIILHCKLLILDKHRYTLYYVNFGDTCMRHCKFNTKRRLLGYRYCQWLCFVFQANRFQNKRLKKIIHFWINFTIFKRFVHIFTNNFHGTA